VLACPIIVVINHEPADKLPMLLAGDLKLTLELEQEELRGAQAREGRWKSGGTQRGLGGEREWEYHRHRGPLAQVSSLLGRYLSNISQNATR
jgi:hypothetical protein